MKITPSLQECLDRFERHATHLNDKRLLAWVRLQMIAEEAQSVTPDQQYVRRSFLSGREDLVSQVYCLQRELEAWERGLETGITNGKSNRIFDMSSGRMADDLSLETLTMHYLYSKAKVLEIPLHAYHDLSQLIAYPFLDHASTPPLQLQPVMAPVYMRSATPFLEACHKVLEYFASLPPDALGNCPTVVFVRAVYTMRALRLITRGSMFEGDRNVHSRIEEIQKRVEKVLIAASREQGRWIPSVILAVWRRMGCGPAGKKGGMVEGLPTVSAFPTPDGCQTGIELTSSYENHILGMDSEQIFAIDDLDIPEIDCSFVPQSTLDTQMIETFLHGFGAADLVI